MSNCVDMSSEQLCYIPCNFCNIVLALIDKAVSSGDLSPALKCYTLNPNQKRVEVPCSSLMETVTVRCGHCGNVWSVNMAAAFHYSLSYSPPPYLWQDVPPPPPQANSYSNQIHRSDNINMGSSSRYRTNNTTGTTRTASAANVTNSAEDRVVNRPPEKRQRVPSAYNQFIKEEIQRIKASNPDISHREAFSTAAKNWAHFPHIHFGLMVDTNNQPKLNEGHGKHLLARTALLNN